jgi:hypothetical protein
MADLRIQRPVPVQATPVSADGRGGGAHRDQSPPRERSDRHGADELAVALAGDGRAAMEAHYEQDAAGNPLIRITDVARGETLAVVTPEELRVLTEHTGLPPGLLLRTSR